MRGSNDFDYLNYPWIPVSTRMTAIFFKLDYLIIGIVIPDLGYGITKYG